MHGVDDPAAQAAVRAYARLLRANRAVVGCVEPRLAEAGLTLTQFGVLEAILHKGPLTHGELGRKVLTSAGNMTDVVDKLEARGFVRRLRSEADRRLVRVDLTEMGRSLIERLFPRHAGDIARALVGLEPAELEHLTRLLRRLCVGAGEPPLAEADEPDHLSADRSISNNGRSNQ